MVASPPPRRHAGTSGRSDRGQAHTLEAVVAAMLLLTSIGFALQMTIVTPLSASTSSQHIENQQRATADGILAAAGDTGSLKRTVLFWNETDGNFHNASDVGYYTDKRPNTTFGKSLERSFDEDGIAFNVNLQYMTPSGEYRERRMIYQGVPTDNAVATSRTIGLRADDVLVKNDTSYSTESVQNSSSFYVGRADSHTTAYYNTVRVQVIVWRI